MIPAQACMPGHNRRIQNHLAQTQKNPIQASDRIVPVATAKQNATGRHKLKAEH